MAYKRPLSPHLQIYNIFSKTMSSGPSIIHRFTQVVLMVSVIYLVALVVCASMGEEYYNGYIKFMTSWFGYISMLGISLCFYYHLVNGIRFLAFNLGYWLSRRAIFISGVFMLLITFVLWLITWIYIVEKFVLLQL
ncbi:succinate dehydrogenase, cytochrome b556 subunit [Rickettsiales bacterium LUAb2]